MLLLLPAAATLLILAAAWYLARPLTAAVPARDHEQRHQLEAMRARLLAQLNELDAERADRGIDDAVAQDEALRIEAELAHVLRDLESLPPPAAEHQAKRMRGWAALALVMILPLSAAGLYGWQQAPLIAALARIAGGEPDARTSLPPEALKMVERLENRLREQPNDAAGWAQLGRSYSVMERLSEAQAAYAKAHALAPDNAEVLSDYAWLVYSDNPHYTEGPAKALYERLLKLDPAHPDALWFLGFSAYNASNFKQAVQYWQRLAALLPPDNPTLPEVQKAIARAQGQAKQ